LRSLLPSDRDKIEVGVDGEIDFEGGRC